MCPNNYIQGFCKICLRMKRTTTWEQPIRRTTDLASGPYDQQRGHRGKATPVGLIPHVGGEQAARALCSWGGTKPPPNEWRCRIYALIARSAKETPQGHRRQAHGQSQRWSAGQRKEGIGNSRERENGESGHRRRLETMNNGKVSEGRREN
jgi:hypothetical protein